MAFQFSDETNRVDLQQNNLTSVGAGLGDDVYVIDADNFPEGNKTITINDDYADGNNKLLLVGGLEIVSSNVYANAVELTLNNGIVVRVLGASTFVFQTGGKVFETAENTTGKIETFQDFVTTSLKTTVPAEGEPVSTGGSVTVQEAGGTEPVDPTNPTDPTEPTEPTEPVEPVVDHYELRAAKAKAEASEGEANTFTVVAVDVDGNEVAVKEAVDVVFELKIAAGDTASLDDFNAGAFNPVTVTIAAGQSVSAPFSVAPISNDGTETTETYTVTATVAGETLTVNAKILDGSPGAGQTFALTTGVDGGAAFTGTSGNDTFNATPFITTAGTSVDTFGALDAIDGGAGNDTFNVVSTATTFSVPTSASVKNIETAVINAAGTVDGDVSGWTGLTNVTVSQVGGSKGNAFTAAATTDVTLTDSAAAVTTTSVQGGKNVSVTANGVTGAGTINVGTVAAAAGTVDVTANMLASQAGAVAAAAAINVKGGTTVNVTANLTEKAGLGNTVTGGAVKVDGTTATTTVTVKQSAAATAANEVLAATGVVAKTAVTAAPGQNGVAAVTAVTEAAAKAAVAGVVNGQVTVTDSAAATGLGTINTVTLENYGATSSVVSNALTDLTLKGTAGTLTLTRAPGLGASDTLNLTLSGLSAAAQNGGSSAITVTNNEIKTLNVKAVDGDSTITAFVDTGLKTLNVSGDKVLTLGTVNISLTKLAVTEAAGFTGDVSALGAALDFTTTSSGKITATLDAATQKFTGSTGQTDITIAADAKVAIVGGSGSNDKLVLNANATTFNTAANVADGKGLTKLVSGFEVLGTSTASQGTFDISSLPSGIKGVSMDGTAAGAISFTKAAPSTTLAINAAQTSAVTLQAADANGVANTVNLTLGSSTNKSGFTVADLTLKDANDVGAGTLNVTTNASTWGQKQTITTLTDNGLSTLNVSGNAGLTITDLTQTTTQATAFTINNTLAGADDVVEITTLANANLGSLTFTGNGNSTVGTLDGLSGKVLTLANTGTGTVSVGNIGTTGLTGGKLEVDTVKINVGLAPGESINVGGRTVTNTSGTATVSATNVAVALSGGAVAAGLEVGGTLTGFTAAVTATDTVTFTSTTNSGTDITYSDTVRPVRADVTATVTDGDGDAVVEKSVWTVPGLTNGQSLALDGLTITAEKTLTGTEVAAAFVAAFAGGLTSAGNYTVSGSFANTATWDVAATLTNVADALTLQNKAGDFTDVTSVTTLTGSAAGAGITDATVLEIVAGAANTGGAQALTTITFNGDVALGANDNTIAATAIGATTGVTVDGATNNAHVNITLNAAAAGATNTIKLGNANNYITDLTSAGKVVIEVGSGGNLIDIAQGAASTYLAEVKLGAHTNTTTVFNEIRVSDADGQADGFSTVITGAVKGDVIVFNNGADLVWDAVTAGEQANITGAANLASAITLAFGTLGAANSATAFTYGGDTYVIQNEAADTVFTTGTDSIIKLTGIVSVGDNGANAGEVVIG